MGLGWHGTGRGSGLSRNTCGPTKASETSETGWQGAVDHDVGQVSQPRASRGRGRHAGVCYVPIAGLVDQFGIVVVSQDRGVTLMGLDGPHVMAR